MDDVLTYAAAITAIAAALAAIVQWVLRPAGRFLKGLRTFLEDWNGEPDRPGVPGRPGVMAYIQDLRRRVATIEHEMHPNSGRSLRDRVDATHALLEERLPDDTREN